MIVVASRGLYATRKRGAEIVGTTKWNYLCASFSKHTGCEI